MNVREAAQRWAQDCIDDWAHESIHELNDIYDTSFTEEELNEICNLAMRAKAVLPE